MRDDVLVRYTPRLKRILMSHWGLWLALSLALVLRLWHLEQSQFFDDQAELMALAHQAVVSGALPVTGILSSIRTLNPPLSIYLLLPVALFTSNPFPSLVALALWNALGVALLYLFALRYAGRTAAILAALLFACASAPVSYSRFLWQQNYLPPVLAVWALTWLAALQGERRRPWLALHVAALLVGILLHPTVAFLIPITLLTLLLARNRPRRWEYATAAGIAVLLLAPTVVWELVSHGFDLPLLARYLGAPKTHDLEVFYRLYVALGAPVDQLAPLKPRAGLLGQLRLLTDAPQTTIFTPGSLYAALGPLWVMLAAALFLLAALGWLVLTARVAGPLVSEVRAGLQAPRPPLAARLSLLWSALRNQDGWQRDLMLWLWITLPVALQVRHTGPVKPHYLMVLYPGVFVVMALGVTWLLARARVMRRARPRLGRVSAAVIIAACVALLCGEVGQSMAVFDGLERGQFSATASNYGYLLSDMQASDALIADLARAEGASSTTILLDQTFAKPLSYLLVTGHPGRIGVVNSCLILPPAASGPSLIVTTGSTGAAARMLAALPGSALLRAIHMRGAEPFRVYLARGSLPPLLPGERGTGGVPFAVSTTPDLRLDALAAVAPGLLRLRWTVLQSTPAGALPFAFHTHIAWQRADGTYATPGNVEDCAPSRWQAGETVFIWLRVPRASTATLAILLQRRVIPPALTTLGPVRLLAASGAKTPYTVLHPLAPETAVQSIQLTADGVSVPASMVQISRT